MKKNFFTLLLTCLLALVFTDNARADTVVVGKTADSNNPLPCSNCSLREAINTINQSPFAGQSQLFFSIPATDPGCDSTGRVCKITVDSEIVISAAGPLVINGPGANLMTIHMGGTDRIFRSRSALTIKGLILEFGQGRGSLAGANGKGSAIYFDGTLGGSLTLDGVIVQNNDSTALSASTGSIYFFGGTNHSISNSTFTGNTSGNCGAFDAESATVSVLNTTISGNTVFSLGGGVCVNNGTTKFRSSTITSNAAGTGGGGGFFVQNGTLNLGNTIVAGNTGGSFPDFRYFGGIVVTAGGNLIGDNSTVASTFPTGISPTGDRSGDSITPLDALFAPLGDYGGITPTRALSAGSPAVDHGVLIFGAGETPSTDQRGGIRDNLIDIGAFEYNAAYVGVLPGGIVGQLYSQVLTSNNNGFTYCISSGGLPPGLGGIPNCASSGIHSNTPLSPQAQVLISGRPTLAGTFPLTVTTTNGETSILTNYSIVITNVPTAAPANVSGQITDRAGSPLEGVVMTLNGADIARRTITDFRGHYEFKNVATDGFYTVTPLRVNYTFDPAQRSFSVLADRSDAVFTAAATALPIANPLDTAEYFVRQQYVDLLDREPDEAGLNYWSDQILACGADVACASVRRRDVAAAFFIEQEFQQSGSFIYDLYAAAFDRKPAFAEYSSDRSQVVGGANLGDEKATFARTFVQRAEFLQKYQSHTTAESFVDALVQNVGQSSGVDLGDKRSLLIARYNLGQNQTDSRAVVLGDIAENDSFKQAEYNSAFVLTEYFGYLRRDPDSPGYDFWLNVLNNRQPGNYGGMVCSFVTSLEYQSRFGPVSSHSNAECTR